MTDIAQRCPGVPNSEEPDKKTIARRQSWRKKIEIVLSDMLTMAKTGFVHGTPSSTVSHVICFWRLSYYKSRGMEEQSNLCELFLLFSGSYECEAVQCSSIDDDLVVHYDLPW